MNAVAAEQRVTLGNTYGYCFRGPKRNTRPASDPAPSKWRQMGKAKELAPELQRLQTCNCRATRPTMFGYLVPMPGVSVRAKGDRAWFGGVYQCGSVWTCPICSGRVAERRRDELKGALGNAVRQDKGVSMVTLTFPHGAGDVLVDILARFSRALRSLKSGRAAAALRDRIGYVGEIRALEVTHGANGWHPHVHAIWITERPLSQAQRDDLRAEIYRAWVSACLKAGLPAPSVEHGVDIRGAKHAAEYVAKWGFATELAGAATAKRGKLGSRTPWQLLADATDGDKRAAWLWREFALAFFGKRQLFWSRGLRDQLSLAPELTDQETMDLDDTEDVRELVLIDYETWEIVRRCEAQEAVLHHAITDLRSCHALLNELRQSDGLPPLAEWEW